MSGCPKVHCMHPICDCVTDENAPLPRADQPAPTPSAAATLYATARVVKVKGDEYLASEIEQAANEIVRLERELSDARQQADGLDELAENNENRAIRAEEALSTAKAEAEMLREAITNAILVCAGGEANARANYQNLAGDFSQAKVILALTLAATRKEGSNG